MDRFEDIEHLVAGLDGKLRRALIEKALAAKMDGRPIEEIRALVVQELRDGHADHAAAAMRQIVSRHPDDFHAALALARCEHAIGNDAAAIAAILRIPADHPVRPEAALFHLSIAPDAQGAKQSLSEIAGSLLNSTTWDNQQEAFVKNCQDLGERGLAVAFLTTWHNNNPHETGALRSLADILFRDGLFQQADTLNRRFWDMVEPLIGGWDGSPENCLRSEDAVLSRIDEAFASPEQAPTLLTLPAPAKPPSRASVLYVGPGTIDSNGTVVHNDLASHIAGTAELAGGKLSLLLDNHLTFPEDVRCPDRLRVNAMDSFRERLAREKPDVFLLDMSVMPLSCGINPSLMRTLKDEFGFRLVLLVRDCYRIALNLIKQWRGTADRFLLFDPTSPAFDEECGFGDAPFAMPVPALHAKFKPSPAPTRMGITFTGSLFAPWRRMMVCALKTTDMEFDLIMGDRRKQLAPDQAGYAALLADSWGVLNISVHTPTAEHLITGRVWETIAAGSLLFEQLNPGTSSYFQPWRHFIPWQKPADIVHACRALKRHPEQRDRIAQTAHSWATHNYGADKWWSEFLDKALEGSRSRDHEA